MERSEVTLGIILRQLRTEQNLSVRELERRAGISHGYYPFIESGQRPPKLDIVAKVAEALGLEYDQVHLLLLIGLRERIGPEFRDYVRAQQPLSTLDNRIVLSYDAPRLFLQGMRDPQTLTRMSNLRGIGWRSEFRRPDGQEQVTMEL